MKITISDQDYTSALDAAHPLSIERKLNEPSVCQFWLTLAVGDPVKFARNQSVKIIGDDGSYYFTGYISVTPMPEYAGVGLEGPRYRLAIRAMSDEFLLDQLSMAPGNGAAGVNAGPLVASLAGKTGSAVLSTETLTLNNPVASFAPHPGARFSASAGKVANQARASYRALNGELTLSSIPATVHPLNESDGSLTLANLAFATGARREFANDITVCGEHEPTAYVTEYFLGDGVTTQFYLASTPYSQPSSRSTIVREQFDEGQIDQRLWGNTGGHGYLSLGAGGLAMQGGAGRDGETQLTWLDPVEMGGTLLLEASGVTLSNGSSGIVAGFFTGEQTQDACIAGFQVTAQQGTGAVSLQPMIFGSPIGSNYQLNSTKQYTLRVRVHCAESQRALAVYRSYGDAGPITSGGEWNLAPARVQFEIQEYVNGVAGMPVTLHEGRISSLPGACKLVAASSVNLIGTMRGVSLTNLGSGWVVTTPANGNPITRRIGTPAQSAECRVESTGTLIFYPGFAPRAGEQIAVSYRSTGRSVGRAVNMVSQQALAQDGLPSISCWIGSVVDPAPRSSNDCRNAAVALEQAAASTTAGWSGIYKGTRAELEGDVWPGDAMQLEMPSAEISALIVVRTVKVSYAASCPDLLHYTIEFANDWADDLAIKTSNTVPADAYLPIAVSPNYMPNLSGLSITSMVGNNVTINAGTTAPDGGGFEIRRRDNSFMPGTDSDLVMRGSQSTMTFSRATASDRFYVRMFDGSNPPCYSEFSAALIFNLALAS